jgi:hypothetical protein
MQKVKRVETDMHNPVKWNLESGDYTDMVREEKKKQGKAVPASKPSKDHQVIVAKN